ncbi:hypothetical protein PSAL_018630 [Pseudooceanicola algae]|uniref:Uncharacterized protein n=2 Tax=Pseudooceanicola algae TaxID=1537215 RepID=A0A418SJP8_9RHOB|nr:hypothetical protein PSAL_018630 [Pseudooceanicola algae]
MFPSPNLFALWKAPFSGDVSQQIEPRLLSDDIAGEPEVEELIHCHVASYETLPAARRAEQDAPR